MLDASMSSHVAISSCSTSPKKFLIQSFTSSSSGAGIMGVSRDVDVNRPLSCMVMVSMTSPSSFIIWTPRRFVERGSPSLFGTLVLITGGEDQWSPATSGLILPPHRDPFGSPGFESCDHELGSSIGRHSSAVPFTPSSFDVAPFLLRVRLR